VSERPDELTPLARSTLLDPAFQKTFQEYGPVVREQALKRLWKQDPGWKDFDHDSETTPAFLEMWQAAGRELYPTVTADFSGDSAATIKTGTGSEQADV
jgi:hypothetical protein